MLFYTWYDDISPNFVKWKKYVVTINSSGTAKYSNFTIVDLFCTFLFLLLFFFSIDVGSTLNTLKHYSVCRTTRKLLMNPKNNRLLSQEIELSCTASMNTFWVERKPTLSSITFPFQCHIISPISQNLYQNQLTKEMPGGSHVYVYM